MSKRAYSLSASPSTTGPAIAGWTVLIETVSPVVTKWIYADLARDRQVGGGFQWKGAAAKWSVMSFVDRYLAKRNGRMMKDAHGGRRTFATIDAAKTFCEEQDQSLMVR